MKQTLLWSLVFACYMITFYDVQYWNYGAPYNPLISAILFPTIRLLWGFNTALTLWLCISGNGVLINQILSCKIFIPLSRLTYSTYLTHAWIIWINFASRRHLIDTNDYSFFLVILQNIVLSYCVSALFAIIFEAPLMCLQKQLFLYLQTNNTITKTQNYQLDHNNNNKNIDNNI